MKRVLLPVDRAGHCDAAVKHLIKEFNTNTAMEIHLLNVQSPFNGDIARFVSRKALREYHREEGEKVLMQVRKQLDAVGIPYCSHVEVGKRAETITHAARRLQLRPMLAQEQRHL